MKKFGLSFLLLLTLSSGAFAQSEVVELELNNNSAQDVEAGEYEIVEANTVKVNDIEFMKFQLQQKYPSLTPCIPSNTSIGLNRGLLVANMAGAMVASYGVFKISGKHDKVKHVLAGYVVGTLTTGSLQLLLPKTMKHKKLVAMLGGFGASILVGIGKEYRDSKGFGNVETKDAIATGLGGIGGTLIISTGDISKAFHKKTKVRL